MLRDIMWRAGTETFDPKIKELCSSIADDITKSIAMQEAQEVRNAKHDGQDG